MYEHEKKWPKTVEARRKRVSTYLKEFGVASRTLEEAKNSEPKNEFEHRAYQLEAWANIWEARQKDKKSALLHLATGLGKTSVAIFDVMKFRKERADSDSETPKVLFVCHQNNILEQAKERFEEFIPEATSGSFRTGQDDLPQSDITFGTFQSLRKELDKLPKDHFDYIIYDEAHHSQADTFSDVVEHFTPEFQLALTATPDRLDEKDITDHFGKPVYSKSLPKAMSEGWLARVDYHIVFDDAVKEAIENDFDVESLGKLRQLMNVPQRNEVIANNVLDKRHEIGLDDAKTIVFCEGIEHAEEMAKLLGGKAYHSEVSEETQKRRLRDFRNGELQVITTRDMFNEGVDIPDARLIVFLRSTASKTVFLQQLGRGLRKQKSKDTVSVLDFAANIERLQMVEELANEMRDVKKPTRRPSDNSILYDGFGEEDSEQEDGMSEESIREEGFVGKTIAWHGNVFEFEAKAMDILEKYKELYLKNGRNNILDMTNKELVVLALELKSDGRLHQQDMVELSKAKLFVSYDTILDRFGSLLLFHEACGFQTLDVKNMTKENIIGLALEIQPEKPLTVIEITELSKKKEFVSVDTIKSRFGGMHEFHEACGFEKIRKAELTNQEIVALAIQLNPEQPLSAAMITKLYRSSQFVSVTEVYRKFGSLVEFQRACGFKVKGSINWVGISNEEIVKMALKIEDKPLTVKRINELSAKGAFPSSRYINKRFGSQYNFHRACGFEEINWKGKTNKEIVALALQLGDGSPLDSAEVEKLARKNKFPGVYVINRRFGSITEFHKICGF